ncbi:VanZ family protein [Streptomyces sp. NPDC044780]|uniref:VanZ family protein n=1 Tax=unclassified Streptomyces TaxID=2593676 RepID=UPI0033DF6BB4
MINIAGWEIRRTKRTAEKQPREGSRTTSARRKTGSQKKTGSKKTGAQQKTGERQKSGDQKTTGATRKGPRTTGAMTKRSRTAKPQTAKAQAAKTGPAAMPRAGEDRATSAPEPQDAPAKAPLQRDSFGSRVARALVLLLAFVCMVGFAVGLAKATLVPSPGSVDLVHTNLRPGQSLRTYLDQPAFRDTVKQIGGNVLLGVPFGVLLPMLVPKARGAVRVVVVTALVMVAVETAQGLIVEGRAFDIDDVILNTTGALLGYVVVGRRLGRALHPRRHHWWHRWTQRPPAA